MVTDICVLFEVLCAHVTLPCDFTVAHLVIDTYPDVGIFYITSFVVINDEAQKG